MSKRKSYFYIHKNKKPKKLKYTYSSKVAECISIASNTVKFFLEKYKLEKSLMPKYKLGTNSDYKSIAISGDVKPEMIMDKNINKQPIIATESVVIANVKVSKDLEKNLLSIKKRFENIPIIKNVN